jgi:lincosamide nucleotidyltransferase A/C/D/E
MNGHWLRRRAVRVARAAYLAIERSPLAPALNVPVVQRLKAQVTYMPASRVLALLDQLAAVGVPVWLAGGWGVDALAGHQTRRHYDLDLLTGADTGHRVADVLRRAGFRHASSQHNPDLPMPCRHVWQHDDGHTVEVLPVALADPPFAGPEFTTGSIDGRPVPCLSATLQLWLHTGYPARPVDAADTETLRGRLDRS